MRRLALLPILTALVLAALAQDATSDFHFVLLGDRTGEEQPGVWEDVWKSAAAEKPDFIVGVGDTIQGGDDATADAEWQQAQHIIQPYRRIPLYLAPGNHDVWSPASEKLFPKYTGHPLHYSFDHGPAHFTILDNSRADAFSAEELVFLEADLDAHKSQPLKFVVSHRPSWLVEAALHNTSGEIQRVAHKYGVQYILAGHVHELIHIDLEGVSYFCAPSAGGHLRASGKYEDGWFFGYTLFTVHGAEVSLRIKELAPPHGMGRITSLGDWELAGLKRQ
jgi:hypothetical protein